VVEGLVGPVDQSPVLLREALDGDGACALPGTEEDVAASSSLVHWVRQWAQTLPFSAELPLPMPLQFDEVAGGARLGFVKVVDGALQMVGGHAWKF
jgi:hypothetical protein